MSGEDTAPAPQRPASPENVTEGRPQVTAADGITRDRISILDLTVGQVAEIEAKLRTPFARWTAAPSTMAVLVAVAAAATGEAPSVFLAMSIRDIKDLVSLDGESDPDQ